MPDSDVADTVRRASFFEEWPQVSRELAAIRDSAQQHLTVDRIPTVVDQQEADRQPQLVEVCELRSYLVGRDVTIERIPGAPAEVLETLGVALFVAQPSWATGTLHGLPIEPSHQL